MTTVTIDIDLDDVIDDMSDRQLIEELQRRMRRGRITKNMLTAAREFLPPNDTDRILRRLADQIACGETAEALDTLATIFPQTPVSSAIGYASRTLPLGLSA